MNYKHIFLTGATGFVGGELLYRLVEQQPRNKFWLLIRGNDVETAKVRYKLVIHQLHLRTNKKKRDLYEQIQYIVGDLEKERLGVSEKQWSDLASKIDIIYHAAGSPPIAAPLEELQQTNVFGTQQVLGLAQLAQQLGGLERLNYISNAYIAGKRTGTIYENELDKKQGFINNFQQSKFEAELLVNQLKEAIPTTIFRPGIIMGDSKTGRTSVFNDLYQAIKLLSKGKLPAIPNHPKSGLDIVPVDYVCDAIVYLSAMNKEVIGKTFHLTAGKGNGTTARKIALWTKNYRAKKGKMIKSPPILRPKLITNLGFLLRPTFSEDKQKMVARLMNFADFIYYKKEFDDSQAAALLQSAGIVAPKLETYFETLLDYATEHAYGKNPEPIRGKEVVKTPQVGSLTE